MTIFYFFLVSLALIIGLFASFLWAWVTVKIQWITYTKICLKQFKNNMDFSDIIFFQNDRYFFYFFMFYLAEFINIILLVFFSIIWMLVWGNFWYIFGLFIVWSISHFFAYFLIKKLLKEIKIIGSDSTINSLELFQSFLKKNQNSNQIEKKEFILIKDNKTAPRNFPFQWNQKRCQKKLQKIKIKTLSETKKKLKMLRIFIWYLKTYAVFFNFLESSSSEYKIKTNHQIKDLNNLKEVLIYNFFVYLQLEARKS